MEHLIALPFPYEKLPGLNTSSSPLIAQSLKRIVSRALYGLLPPWAKIIDCVAQPLNGSWSSGGSYPCEAAKNDVLHSLGLSCSMTPKLGR